MKRFALLALFLCTSFVFAEADPQVKPCDVCEANSVKDDSFINILFLTNSYFPVYNFLYSKICGEEI